MKSQRFWQPARREFLYLALAGMDTCILIPIVLAIGQDTLTLPRERATLTFFIVILFAFNLVRALTPLNLRPSVQRDIGLFVLLLWIALALRLTLYRHSPPFSLRWLGEMASRLREGKTWLQDLMIILAVLVFWWRGLALAGRPLHTDSIGYYFRAGVLLLALVVGLVSRLASWSPIPFVLAYFFLSLVSVALARAEEVGRWRAGLVFPFNAGWFLSIMTAAGVVILIAVGLIALFTGESLVRILALLGPVWDVVSYLIAGALTLIFILVGPLLNALMKLIMNAVRQSRIEMPEVLFGPMTEFEYETLTAPPTTNLALYRPILTALLLVGVILVVALALGQVWRARNQLGAVQTRAVEREPGNLVDRARKGLRSLFGQIGLFNRWYTAASIRRIYAQMVATAGRRGYPRADSETPSEYLPTLTQAWPSLESQFGMITGAYIRTHYGELPETETELEAIRAAWEQVQLTVKSQPRESRSSDSR